MSQLLEADGSSQFGIDRTTKEGIKWHTAAAFTGVDPRVGFYVVIASFTAEENKDIQKFEDAIKQAPQVVGDTITSDDDSDYDMWSDTEEYSGKDSGHDDVFIARHIFFLPYRYSQLCRSSVKTLVDTIKFEKAGLEWPIPKERQLERVAAVSTCIAVGMKPSQLHGESFITAGWDFGGLDDNLGEVWRPYISAHPKVVVKEREHFVVIGDGLKRADYILRSSKTLRSATLKGCTSEAIHSLYKNAKLHGVTHGSCKVWISFQSLKKFRFHNTYPCVP